MARAKGLFCLHAIVGGLIGTPKKQSRTGTFGAYKNGTKKSTAKGKIFYFSKKSEC
jgi:hypothetical protein